jgi:hypothetical protein
MHAGPAQMIRDPFRLKTLGELLESLEIFELERAVEAIDIDTPCMTMG